MVNRLQIVLRSKKIKQEELAMNIDTTTATISRWCNNNTQPSWIKLNQIAEYLDVNLADLIYSVPIKLTYKKDDILKLNELNTGDVFLLMIKGRSNIENIKNSIFAFKKNVSNGYDLNHLVIASYISQYQNPEIPTVMIGKIIPNCGQTEIRIENCNEEIDLFFLCPAANTSFKK